MISVPVTVGFGSPGKRQAIGYLVVDEARLPKGADFVFAIGGKILEGEFTPGDPCSAAIVQEFKLLQVAIVSDREYMDFLTARQKAGAL